MTQPRIRFEQLVERLEAVFLDAGASPEVASVLAENCAACERDGAFSHGVFRVRGYVASIRGGWADGRATPVVTTPRDAVVAVDAANGFAQPALAAATPSIQAALDRTGVAVVTISTAHHFSSLWPDLEPFARRGYLGIALVSTGAGVTPPGADRRMLGTNPIAFAMPTAGAHPLVFDFATSTMSLGDLELRSRAGEEVPDGTGVGRDGRATRDPGEILHEGGLLPFGGHKGLGISLMVEGLVVGLTGAPLPHRLDLIRAPSPDVGMTDRTGQVLIFIDPATSAGFADRARMLVDELRAAGVDRLPGDHRYRQRVIAERDGIPVTPEIEALLAG